MDKWWGRDQLVALITYKHIPFIFRSSTATPGQSARVPNKHVIDDIRVYDTRTLSPLLFVIFYDSSGMGDDSALYWSLKMLISFLCACADHYHKRTCATDIEMFSAL